MIFLRSFRGGGNLHDVFADLVGLFLLWLQFYVFMEALLRRRALCAALVLVLRLGGFQAVHSDLSSFWLCRWLDLQDHLFVLTQDVESPGARATLEITMDESGVPNRSC
ncbi:unnamed protein product [Durusdinium trenchii]|uniref:Secreted protein n=1 Tax=Durusdinium trenchii TaxID=1381693 RepID=A0ABP0M9G1_9DINO